MPAISGPRIWSKKPKPNPYSQRGLDQFALVSAELQAARDRLVAQLGTQLSLVRFTSSSDQGTWIPIITASTSSKAEIRALRRAASDLIAGRKDAVCAEHDSIPAAGSLLKHLGSSVGEYATHEGCGIREKNAEHDNSAQLHSAVGKISNESSSVGTENDAGTNPIRKHDNQTGILHYLMVATQGFVWMLSFTAFGLSILADLASMALLSERHMDGGENAVVVLPHADHTASSSHTASQAQPTSTARRDIKGLKALPPLHVGAPKTHIRSKDRRVSSTCPSSPRDSQQLAKPLAASVSLPRTAYLQGQTLHSSNKENKQAQKTSQNKAGKGSASTVDTTASMISSPENLGQALSGAGLVIVLVGLVMGYIPAIVSVLCWWYVLPSMRKAIGDKPVVRSHHHHHHESQEDKASIGPNSVNNSFKDDMQYQEKKKKAIMDGLLERRQRHSNI